MKENGIQYGKITVTGAAGRRGKAVSYTHLDVYKRQVLTMLGGLCLFLFGMTLMGQALERRAGGRLRSCLLYTSGAGRQGQGAVDAAGLIPSPCKSYA